MHDSEKKETRSRRAVPPNVTPGWGIILGIDIDLVLIVVRVLAAALTAVALLCWARVGVRFLAPGLAMVLVMLIAEIDSGWMKHLDATVEAWVRPHRSAGAVAAGADLWRHMGNPVHFLVAVLGCGIVVSWRARSAKPGAVLAAAVGFTYLLEHALKATVGRATETVAGLQGRHSPPGTALSYLHSFPSGHVAVIGVLVGAVAVLLGSGRSAGTKVQLAALAGSCWVVIGVQAVYIRAHTATDAIGGMVLAGAVIAAWSVVPAVRTPAPQRHPGSRRRPVDVRSAQRPAHSQRVPVG